MAQLVLSGPSRDGREPTDLALLETPLEFIASDHLRERRICADLDKIATSDMLDRKLAQGALRFLNEELATHVRDEVEDLFPLLRRRCPPEDDIDRAIARVAADQDAARILLPTVRPILACCLDAGRIPTPSEAERLGKFTRHSRRHLIAENAILLPLARLRLTESDLQSLRLRMCARRGVSDMTETVE